VFRFAPPSPASTGIVSGAAILVVLVAGWLLRRVTGRAQDLLT
jgi:hypothetical protein